MGLTARPDTTGAQLQKLLDEQAALRRVATFVAADPEPATVFERVCAEVGSLFEVESTNLVRFEGDGTATVTGHWPLGPAPVLSTGEEVPLEGETSTVKVSRSGRPERVDEYTTASGGFVGRLRAVGIASSIAAPITVAGELWGALVASSGRPTPSRRAPRTGSRASPSWSPTRSPTPMPASNGSGSSTSRRRCGASRPWSRAIGADRGVRGRLL